VPVRQLVNFEDAVGGGVFKCVLSQTLYLDPFLLRCRGGSVDIGANYRLAARDSNPAIGDIFFLLRKRPDRFWGSSSLLFSG
jgi:hypothetical protein